MRPQPPLPKRDWMPSVHVHLRASDSLAHGGKLTLTSAVSPLIPDSRRFMFDTWAAMALAIKRFTCRPGKHSIAASRRASDAMQLARSHATASGARLPSLAWPGAPRIVGSPYRAPTGSQRTHEASQFRFHGSGTAHLKHHGN